MKFCTGLETGKGSRDRHGSAAVVAIVAVVVLVGLCGAMLMIATRSADERVATVDRHQALAAAHAGIGHAMVALTEDDDVREVGTPDDPVAFGGGSYWATITPEGNSGAFTVASFATVRGETEAVEALVDGASLDIYDHALFAGNSSGDPRYSMRLGGSGAQADLINGDVYSGGGVIVSGNASVTGTIRADGTIVGASGETDVSQPIPDIAAMDYPRTADFKVAALFAGAAYKSDDAGGKAWQLPESSPAHIFRKNPSDRVSDNDSTRKDDYYLEDPYEPVNSDGGSNGSNPYPITLSGVSGEPGINGNKKVYYIDGNLWIHNKNTFSFEIQHDLAAGVQVTFVAKGNIYFSDNVFYDDVQKDGIAFIAMKDSAEADSGNIYFGDPLFGTLEQMHAFMYAENNFIDKNLSATGSAQVAVYGNMTAGNKVDIQRDFDGQHSKLTVNYDGRISSGDLKMPGLPRTPDADDGDLRLTAWRRIPEQ